MIRLELLLTLLTLACITSLSAQQPAAPAPAPTPAPSVAQPVVDTPPAATPAPAPATPAAPGAAPAAAAQPTLEKLAAENPNHEQLRVLRDGIMDAMNRKDMESLVSFLHPSVVFTTMNGDVARGRQGIREYYNKMMVGPNRVVDSVTVKLIADELTALYLNDSMGICHGSTQDVYTLKGGQRLDINARWTATMIKEDGKWLVVAIHYSTNMFDNPVLTAVQKTMMMVGMGCAVVGLLLGMMIGRKTGGRR
ncbi:nuclear transport factor 2 family protein [Roseimicrobium sp. ORNL1]|uniref:SgcJ/EcaC family oxidoreductase n=1 Tax=Roseimicrobium sp. ORNL1 TaxID=2711231 RepID=UPI0013E1AF9B|nr:nuclear transport factor 2 family protein [Roseimicrobium sp. ORNL1]QIF00632.1 nuclear transport factor 2 family protein [Roseimicrobium sp. ORNL1]